MPTKKKTPLPRPVRVFRSGSVAANIVAHQADTGFRYEGLILTREFTDQSGKPQVVTSFFPQDEEDLVKAVRQAMAYLDGAREKKLAA